MSALHLADLTRLFHGASTPALDRLTLKVEDGEILSITGESGSGKTTLLRIIAGLDHADSGSVSIGGKLMCGPGTSPVAPEQRGVGMVFQNFALFPHLSVRDNVLYGIRHLARTAREAKLAQVLGLTGLCGFEKRFPHEVSGGQQQRIALARALAPQPRIILLDEPFSNLDVSLRQQLREDVGRILRAARSTALLVTHDTRDALAISDRIAVLKSGRLQQLGTPRDIYHAPANEVTALLFGRMNLLPASILPLLSETHSPWTRPEDLALVLDAPAHQPALPGTIVRTHFYGDHLEVHCSCRTPSEPALDVVVHAPGHAALKAGTRVWITRRA
jgi:iron(III) transport system ATP-binding protein